MSKNATEPSLDKLCLECRSSIAADATKCVHCDSRQDWRRFFDFGSTALSLLVALVSVAGLSVTSIVTALSDNDAKLKVSNLSMRIDYLPYQDKLHRSFVATIWVTNSGKLPGAIKGVSFKIANSESWNPNVVIFDKEADGQPVSVGWTTAIIPPSGSRILDIFYPTNAPDTDLQSLHIKVETIRFDGKSEAIIPNQ